jgi:hypothetical protein
MYRNASDALFGLVSGLERDVAHLPWKLKMTEPATIENGIDYFCVEVTFGNGVQYGIQAYGDEAHELRKSAMIVKSGETIPFQAIVAQ